MAHTTVPPKWTNLSGLSVEDKYQLLQQSDLAAGLFQQQKDGLFCDVVIRVDNKSFQAHRTVLSACSDYFKTMFTAGFRESVESEININGGGDIFSILLEFAYTGKLDFTVLNMERICDVLEMAHYLQFRNALERCSSYLVNVFQLQEELDLSAAVMISKHASLLGLKNLKKSSYQIIASNFTSCNTKFHLEHMTADVIDEILHIRHAYVLDATEEQILDLILAWLKHDWEHRKYNAKPLLKKIRLGLVPLAKLKETILWCQEVEGMAECKQLLKDVVMKLSVASPDDEPLECTDPDMFVPRTPGLLKVNHTEGSLAYFDAKIGKWRTLFKGEPHTYYKGAMIFIEGQLYCAGGSPKPEPVDENGIVQPQRRYRGQSKGHTKQRYNQFWCFDVATEKWHQLPDMKHCRNDFQLVHLEGYIYAIGGASGLSRALEKYNMQEKKWVDITDLPQGRSRDHMSAVEYGGKILVYFVGSSYSQQSQHYLYMYNPNWDSWHLVLSYNHVYLATSLLSHGGKIYRIVRGKCTCQRHRKEDCQWQGFCIHELKIDTESNIPTASVGKLQRQKFSSERTRKFMFHIGKDVFVSVKYGQYFSLFYHNTGMKIADAEPQVDFEPEEWSCFYKGQHPVFNLEAVTSFPCHELDYKNHLMMVPSPTF